MEKTKEGGHGRKGAGVVGVSREEVAIRTRCAYMVSHLLAPPCV